MCTLIILYKVLARYPIIALQNRYAERGSSEGPPRRLDIGKYTVYCPLETRIGGTWIGFNEKGLFLAVTDQHTPGWQRGTKSRGKLLLSLLGNYENSDEVLERLIEELPSGYKKGNFVIADFNSAFHIVYDEEIIISKIMSNSVHVITNLTPIRGHLLDSNTEEILTKAEFRRLRALELVSNIKMDKLENIIEGLKAIATDHAYGKSELSICYHNNGKWFMSSSTIIAICENIVSSKILYCSGNACEGQFMDFSYLLRL